MRGSERNRASKIHRRSLAPMLLVVFLTAINARATLESIPADPEELPYGVFPDIRALQEAPRDNKDLQTEIKHLGKRMESTVKDLATRRNTSCFDQPCLVQYFPLLYERADSGLFAGVRLNIANIKRVNPFLWTLNAQLVRSDTRQYRAFASFDLPKIEELPREPRIKMRVDYARTTDTRYFGIGPASQKSFTRPDEQLRYALSEIGVQSTVLVPLDVDEIRKVNLFTLLSTSQNRPAPLNDKAPSKLYEDRPAGADHGGVSAGLGIGVMFDERDRETFSREGWAVETSAQIAPPWSEFSSRRLSLIDRRYYSWDRYTLALRTTADWLSGNAAFWELESVGGVDPIRDVSSPELLRAYTYGRFHERLKLILNIDQRWFFQPTRVFGQFCEIIFVPLGIDIGRLGLQNAWSLSMSTHFLFNRSFLIRTLAGYAPTGWHFRLAFGEEY